MTTKLSEIISVLESGSRPKGGVKEGSEGIPSLGGEHLSKEGGFNFSKLKMITHEFYSKMKRGKIEIGDILIVKDGATTGKVAIVREDFPFKEAAINEHLFRIRVDSDKAIQEYIFRYLQSPLGQLQILSSFRGAAIGGINTSFVDRVSLDLPPLDEQKRIATILDKADEIGKNSEQTNVLQERIAESLFIDLFGDPLLNDRCFPLTTLSDVCEVISGFAFKSSEYSENPSHINLVRGQNISHGFLDWKLGKYWENMDDSLEKYQLLEGDIVLAMDRPIISTGLKISEITPEDTPALLVQRVARIRSSLLPPSFILALLKHPIFIRTIESSKTETTIPHITLRNVKELQFPLPPSELLEQYSNTIHFFRQIIHHSSERISSSGNFKQSLTQQLIS